ncbi:PAN domain-containing protein [Pochonia chlamydosporia 170]|uniref:PAN domain-containing protein n=1 Tax=Pochonia chlamydosporia 170 TaxID=1380566 RepID=A0A179FH41_METCM|nr:PAN domain-containing protein [Pochonia chlamydosporia 170]OAQ64369.1 PAN domain-containing protein [Pochonia chlamydosporia 170]
MKTTSFWAVLPLLAPAALAKPAPTPTTTPSSCTASLVTTICDYPTPGPEFAIASDGKSSCWEYCNKHQPCNFVIFVAGNPYTGTGTCWLYPGQKFDPSKASSSCGHPSLSVFDKPVCSGSPDGCAATASPSAVAEVCGYPAPGDCFDNCYASSGASQCLSLCAKADVCEYAVFNPHNPTNSPYGSGTCWVYGEGKYEPGKAGTCAGAVEQYVYNNVCPKPRVSSTSAAVKATGTGTGTGGSTGGGSGSGSSSGSGSGSGSGKGSGTETGTVNGDAVPVMATSTSENLAPTGLSFGRPLAVGVAALAWQGL